MEFWQMERLHTRRYSRRSDPSRGQDGSRSKSRDTLIANLVFVVCLTKMQVIGLGATFNTSLYLQIGIAISTEVQTNISPPFLLLLSLIYRHARDARFIRLAKEV